MRMLLPGLAALVAMGCSSSGSTVQDGPSISGSWSATDTTHRVMVLQLNQKGGAVTGTGTIGATPLTVAGSNRISTCNCLCPCAYDWPIQLKVADAAGDTIQVFGNEAKADSMDLFIANKSGPPPGFPFAARVVGLFKSSP